MEQLSIHVLRAGMRGMIREYNPHRYQWWTLHVKCRVIGVGAFHGDRWVTRVQVTGKASQLARYAVYDVPTFGVAPRDAFYWHNEGWDVDYVTRRKYRVKRGYYRPWGVIPDNPTQPCPATLVSLDGRLMQVSAFGDWTTVLLCPFTSQRLEVTHDAYETVTPGETYSVDYYGKPATVTIPGGE